MRTPEEASNLENDVEGQNPETETHDTKKKPEGDSKGDKAKKSIKDSFQGLKEVGGLKKQAAALESEMHDAEAQYADDKEAYEKRIAIASNYGEIIATRNQVVQDAQENISAQQANIAQFEKELAPQKKQLDQIVKRHERELQPYKERLESAEAEYAQAEARVESVNRSLEGARTALSQTLKQIEDATKREASAQQEILTLNKAVMNIKKEGQAVDAAALQSQLSVANMNLSSAQSAKTTATSMRSSAEQDVRNFENELNQAVTGSSAKKSLLNSAQADFNKITAEQAEQQAPIRSIVEPLEREIVAARESIEASNMQLMEAQEAIDEANDINDHPEETERMKNALDALEKRIEQLKKELEELKALIAKASKGATKAKLLIVGIIVAVIVLIVAGIAIFNAATEFAAEQERAAAIAAQEQAEAEAKAKAEEEERVRQEAIDEGAIPISDEHFIVVTRTEGDSAKLESIASDYDEDDDGLLSIEELGEISEDVVIRYQGQSTIDALAKSKARNFSLYVGPGVSGTMDLSVLAAAQSICLYGSTQTSSSASDGNDVTAVSLPNSGGLLKLSIVGLSKLTSIANLDACAGLQRIALVSTGLASLDLANKASLEFVRVANDPALASLVLTGSFIAELVVTDCPNLVTIEALNTPRLDPSRMRVPEGVTVNR